MGRQGYARKKKQKKKNQVDFRRKVLNQAGCKRTSSHPSIYLFLVLVHPLPSGCESTLDPFSPGPDLLFLR